MAAVLIMSVVLFFEFTITFSNVIARLVLDLKHDKKKKLLEMKGASKSLLEELQRLSPMDEFANFARTQRRLNKSKAEISMLVKEIKMETAKIVYPIKIFNYIAYTLTTLTILFMYRSVPCIQIPAQWLYPFGSLFSFPLMIPGVISVPIWLMICRNVSKIIFYLMTS